MGVRRSLIVSFAEKYSITFVQLISSLIIARLLSPTEIGLFSVAMLIIGFAHMLRDFGVSNYLVQERELSPEKIRAAFTVTLIIAWTAAVLLHLLSPLLAYFFEQPSLIGLINVLSINFWLIPFSSVAFGLLRRQLNFNALYWINTLTALVSSVLAVILAYSGFSFMSLAWAAVAGSVVTVLLTNLFQPDSAIFWPSRHGVKAVLGFGSKSSVASLAIEAGQSAPELVIGKIINFEAVGFFSRAMGLATLFNKLIMSAVQSVAIPYFANHNRSDANMAAMLEKTLNYLLCIAWPFYVFIAVFADEIILLLYGDQWGDSVVIAQLLCLVFCIRVIPSIISWSMVSVGEVGKNMRGRLIWELSSLLFIIPAAYYSVNWVAAGLIFSNLLGLGIFIHYAAVLFGSTLKQLGKLVLMHGLFAVTLWLLLLGYKRWLPAEWSQLYLLLPGAMVLFIVYFGLFIGVTKHPIWLEVRARFISRMKG
ncbi:lipopolysaccharide biosynthesis protein [Rheinheimera sp.]|uniref:lipopolysaccharide biosynthesis protein n=1 Tax=Rheinheimera sp. TaxID=1869214 RepID=UPI00404895C0